MQSHENFSLATKTAFIALAASIACLTISHPYKNHMAFSLLGTSVLAGLKSQVIKPAGAIMSIFYVIMAHLRFQHNALKDSSTCLTLLMSFLLTLHKIPGFNNPIFFQEKTSLNAPIHTAYLNFDKALVGFTLLATYYSTPQNYAEWNFIARISLCASILTIPSILCAALLAKLVQYDLKWPDRSLLWLTNNLIFVCVAEETLFRLPILWAQNKGHEHTANLISATLFGLAHHAAGAKFSALAGLAGLGYGYSFIYSRNITASIFTHFLLNTCHYISFTYPLLTAKMQP